MRKHRSFPPVWPMGQIDIKPSCKSQFVSRSWKIPAVASEGKQRWLDCFRGGRVARLGRLFVDRYTARNQRVTGNHLGTESFVRAKWAGPFYDAAVSTTALDVRPDFRFAIWPSPLFFASADRVAAYSGATIG